MFCPRRDRDETRLIFPQRDETETRPNRKLSPRPRRDKTETETKTRPRQKKAELWWPFYINKKWHVLILVNWSCQTKLSLSYVFSSWVYGGVGWWGLRVILVLSLSLDQVERFLFYFQGGYFDGTWCILNTPSGYLDTFPLHRLAIEMSCHIYDI